LATPPTQTNHIAPDDDTLDFDDKPLTSIANGSLQNKIFPLQKEIFNMLKEAFENWHRKNSMPSVPSSDIPHLWDDCWPQHCNQLHNHVNYPS
jgi:hypothetical protein